MENRIYFLTEKGEQGFVNIPDSVFPEEIVKITKIVVESKTYLSLDIEKSKYYKDILKHRNNCPKWTKEFCLDCFGGGLTKFFKEFAKV